MYEQTGVSADLDSEGCLSSIKSSTTKRNWSEPERIKIPQSEKLLVVGGPFYYCATMSRVGGRKTTPLELVIFLQRPSI